MHTQQAEKTGEGIAPRVQRAYWRQNTFEGHPHSYTLVNGQQIQDFSTYGKLCAYCRKHNIVAQLA